MTKKRRTRRALINSVISLLICFSMLLGTTFAWFTDEVKTGMNTIVAGNLDVELLANGTKVDSNTELFDDVKLWEPGAVAYENLQVSNVGTLALKYQMSLNFGNENDLNGHKLSEVLKVVKLDETIDTSTMTRAQVLEKAKAALGQGKGALSNFYLTGELEAQTDGPAFAVVVFWEPNANEIDNLYNVNNGQLASDGKDHLYIDLGVNLQATQKMSEEDSFGNDYDEFANILPKATVNSLGAQKVMATTNGWTGTATEYNLDASFQFLPNETYEEAQSSAYRYYHADYVVKADKDVKADSMALVGYYKVFCDGYNNGNWVALTSGEDIPANTPIRLVQAMGGGSISVNYEEICNFGNDGTGFMCGVQDLDGTNVGTTITVELRLYETTKDPNATSGTANDEVGPDAYEVVGTYTYTFGGYEVESVDELNDAIANGATEIKLVEDLTLTDSSIVVPAAAKTTLDLNGKTMTVENTTAAASSAINNKGELTLKNGTVTYEGVGDPNFGYGTNTINNTGKLVIDGATIINTTASGSSVAIDNSAGAELIVNSGVITSVKNAIRLCPFGSAAINATINGGTITGARAIQIQLPSNKPEDAPDVNLTVNGGTLTGTSGLSVYSYSYGQSFADVDVVLAGGVFNNDVAFGGGSAKATQENVIVTGGTFNGALGRYVEDDGTNNGWEDIAKP